MSLSLPFFSFTSPICSKRPLRTAVVVLLSALLVCSWVDAASGSPVSIPCDASATSNVSYLSSNVSYVLENCAVAVTLHANLSNTGSSSGSSSAFENVQIIVLSSSAWPIIALSSGSLPMRNVSLVYASVGGSTAAALSRLPLISLISWSSLSNITIQVQGGVLKDSLLNPPLGNGSFVNLHATQSIRNVNVSFDALVVANVTCTGPLMSISSYVGNMSRIFASFVDCTLSMDVPDLVGSWVSLATSPSDSTQAAHTADATIVARRTAVNVTVCSAISAHTNCASRNVVRASLILMLGSVDGLVVDIDDCTAAAVSTENVRRDVIMEAYLYVVHIIGKLQTVPSAEKYLRAKNVTVVLTRLNAQVVSTSVASVVILSQYFDVVNVSVLLEHGVLYESCDGLVMNITAYRSVDVVRLEGIPINVGWASNVTIHYDNVSLLHDVLSGVDRAAVASGVTYGLQGVGGQLLYINADTRSINITMTRISYRARIVNGTLMLALQLDVLGIRAFAGFGVLAAAFVNVGDAAAMESASITISESGLWVDVGFGVARPLAAPEFVGPIGFYFTLLGIVLLSNCTLCDIAVHSSRVEVLSMNFTTLGSTQSMYPVCPPLTNPFDLNRNFINTKNATGFVALVDKAVLGKECSAVVAMFETSNAGESVAYLKTPYPPTLEKVRISVHNCTLISLPQGSTEVHLRDVATLVVPGTRCIDSEVRITDCTLQVAQGSTATAVACLKCELLRVRVAVRRVTGLGMLFACLVDRASFADTSFLASESSFDSVAPAPPLTAYLLNTFAGASFQNVTLAVTDCAVGSAFRAVANQSSSIQWLASTASQRSLMRFECVTWKGVSRWNAKEYQTRIALPLLAGLNPAAANAPNVAFDACGHTGTVSVSPTATDELPTIVPSEVVLVQRASSSAAVVVAALVAAGTPVKSGVGLMSISAIQASRSAMRLSSGESCALQRARLPSADAGSAGSFSAAISNNNGGGGGESNANDGIGSQIADNPTRLHVGGRLGYAGGTVVGNLLLVVAGGVFIALVQHVCSVVQYNTSRSRSLLSLRSTTNYRRKDENQSNEGPSRTCSKWDWGTSPSTAASDALAAAVPLYGAVVQPTTTAAVLLVTDIGHAESVVVGILGVLLVLAPMVLWSAALFRRPSGTAAVMFPLTFQRNEVVARRSRMLRIWVRFVAPVGRWVVAHDAAAEEGKFSAQFPSARSRNRNSVSGLVDDKTAVKKRARLLMRYGRALLEPYRAPFYWMYLVECGTTIVQGIIVGAATVVGAAEDISEAECRATLQVCGILLLCMGCILLLAIVSLRPYAAGIDSVASLAVGALGCLGMLLALLEQEDNAAYVLIVQSLLGAALMLVPVVQWMSGLLLFQRPRSKPSAAAEPASANNATIGGGGGEQEHSSSLRAHLKRDYASQNQQQLSIGDVLLADNTSWRGRLDGGQRMTTEHRGPPPPPCPAALADLIETICLKSGTAAARKHSSSAAKGRTASAVYRAVQLSAHPAKASFQL